MKDHVTVTSKAITFASWIKKNMPLFTRYGVNSRNYIHRWGWSVPIRPDIAQVSRTFPDKATVTLYHEATHADYKWIAKWVRKYEQETKVEVTLTGDLLNEVSTAPQRQPKVKAKSKEKDLDSILFKDE
jgi:hypothetical protein